MTVSVIIPALNEESSISEVIHAIPKENITEIIVVDNGSVDRTAEFAARAGARLVREPCRGYGRACLRGIQSLKPANSDIIVFLDADYSDYPEELTRIIDPIIFQGYDMVIGSRLLDLANKKNISQINWLGNRLICWFIRFFFGVKYSDLGPFRAIRRESLERLNMQDLNFGWTVEMQIKAALCGLKIKEVPVLYRKRIGRSKITGTFPGSLKACGKISYLAVKYALMRRKLLNEYEAKG
ncbi:MAG: glycosyltransferase family 2 protein [Candidatus Omnitrophota bacterium]